MYLKEKSIRYVSKTFIAISNFLYNIIPSIAVYTAIFIVIYNFYTNLIYNESLILSYQILGSLAGISLALASIIFSYAKLIEKGKNYEKFKQIGEKYFHSLISIIIGSLITFTASFVIKNTNLPFHGYLLYVAYLSLIPAIYYLFHSSENLSDALVDTENILFKIKKHKR